MEGFWEPHSSSIDFCETNYILTNHVVEIHNTWSSILGLCLFGVIGLVSGNPTGELRHTIAYLLLVCIGVGSAGLHGTLHWIFQSSDELPMVYLVASIAYMLFEFSSPLGKLKYPKLPAILMFLMIVNTFVYYKYQHLYMIFYLTFSISSTFAIVMVYKMMKNKKRGEKTKRIGKLALFYYVCIGIVVWHIEMFFCDTFLDTYNKLPSLLKGMTVHVVWHIAAGFGTYHVIVFLECCRLEELNLQFNVVNRLGIIPIAVLNSKEATNTGHSKKIA
mmetsp:Transcript_11514/g.14416  ORF Transcript_11514/g.14416 Transcript_11514/m.14416 type:complete len:275 (-) Transcript_11514:188-1012(-)